MHFLAWQLPDASLFILPSLAGDSRQSCLYFLPVGDSCQSCYRLIPSLAEASRQTSGCTRQTLPNHIYNSNIVWQKYFVS